MGWRLKNDKTYIDSKSVAAGGVASATFNRVNTALLSVSLQVLHNPHPHRYPEFKLRYIIESSKSSFNLNGAISQLGVKVEE
jgi:hypothetical protein